MTDNGVWICDFEEVGPMQLLLMHGLSVCGRLLLTRAATQAQYVGAVSSDHASLDDADVLCNETADCLRECWHNHTLFLHELPLPCLACDMIDAKSFCYVKFWYF